MHFRFGSGVRAIVATLLLFPIACGLELAGEIATSPNPTAADGSAGDDANASSDGNAPVDASSSSSGNIPIEGGLDGTAPGASVALTVAASPTNVNLTNEGTIDWAHWGYAGATGPVRRGNTTAAIATFTFTGTSVMTGSFENTGWPIRVTWNNGQNPMAGSNSGWYAYFTNSPDVAIAIPVSAATTERTLALYLGVGDVNARVEASLDDGSAQAVQDFDNAQGTAKRVQVVYRAVSATVKLVVRYRIVTRKNTTSNAAISLGAATLH